MDGWIMEWDDGNGQLCCLLVKIFLVAETFLCGACFLCDPQTQTSHSSEDMHVRYIGDSIEAVGVNAWQLKCD